MKNAEVEYHYQRFLNIFEYNHVVHAVPPPLNLPVLLLAELQQTFSFVGRCLTCGGGGGGVVWNQGVMRPRDSGDLLVEALEQVSPDLQAGGPGQQTMPISRKYVQRYLKGEGDHDAERNAVGLVRRVEGLVEGLEERFNDHLEQIDRHIDARGGGGGGGGGGAAAAADVMRAVSGLSVQLGRIEAAQAEAHAAGHSTKHSLFWLVMRDKDRERGDRRKAAEAHAATAEGEPAGQAGGQAEAAARASGVERASTHGSGLASGPPPRAPHRQWSTT